MGKKITRDVINDYLRRGFHVHIRVEDEKGNKRIVETIFVIEVPSDQICTEIHKKVEYRIGNVVVASRAFLSPRDKPNKRTPNEVVVGRIIRKIEEGRGLSFKEEINLCGDISVFQTWLTMGLPLRTRDIKKIAVFRYKDSDYMERAKREIKLYKEHVESTRSLEECMKVRKGVC